MWPGGVPAGIPNTSWTSEPINNPRHLWDQVQHTLSWGRAPLQVLDTSPQSAFSFVKSKHGIGQPLRRTESTWQLLFRKTEFIQCCCVHNSRMTAGHRVLVKLLRQPLPKNSSHAFTQRGTSPTHQSSVSRRPSGPYCAHPGVLYV